MSGLLCSKCQAMATVGCHECVARFCDMHANHPDHESPLSPELASSGTVVPMD
ncbi:MAG: hypothetical protein KGQ66_14290 [Acidobacteriota bacterium]|nr:hypothetical protein [Acidobacteriota bacterium]